MHSHHVCHPLTVCTNHSQSLLDRSVKRQTETDNDNPLSKTEKCRQGLKTEYISGTTGNIKTWLRTYYTNA